MKCFNFVPCLVCTLAISATSHAAEIRTVFLSGQQAPGMPEGAVFSQVVVSSGMYLQLNDAGQTAFQAQLTGSGVDSTNNSGIWSEGSGSLARVANVSGGNARDLVLNDAGQTAFFARLPDGQASGQTAPAVWRWWPAMASRPPARPTASASTAPASKNFG